MEKKREKKEKKHKKKKKKKKKMKKKEILVSQERSRANERGTKNIHERDTSFPKTQVANLSFFFQQVIATSTYYDQSYFKSTFIIIVTNKNVYYL